MAREGHLDEWWDALPAGTCEEAERLLERVEATGETFYPPHERVFEALRLTGPRDVRAIILGQDPYHEPGQAIGVAFSVPAGCKLPPSLRNILTELHDDLGVSAASGDITAWAHEGVLMLNTVLTVPEHQAGGHAKLGWQSVTSNVLLTACALNPHVVVLCWGMPALRSVRALGLDASPRVRLLTSTHPSPLSARRATKELRPFVGSRPFSHANALLTEAGVRPIDWGVVGRANVAPHRFFGWEQAVVLPSNPAFARAGDPRRLYDLLISCWDADTCAPRLRGRWTPENPACGQCSITAFLAQDIYGGVVRGIPLPDGNFHCYNVVEGRTFDLTSEQFSNRLLDYGDNPEQLRSVHFAKTEKRERYGLLRARLERLLT